ncbi:hypothetical protein HanRHA438_Chr13g0604991 [Helianthus annuus]|nr:hypothetical protein HanIR_Chr13g0646591 [Helianthus annuus]KAJ0858777.1 hypothetical protein HanRHA438_Chr13g0604991 [Helianthus annuus]
MVRLISLNSGEEGGILELEGSHIVFMLCMIVVSISVLTMIIFACGDSNDNDSPNQRPQYAGAVASSAGSAAIVGGGGGGGC